MIQSEAYCIKTTCECILKLPGSSFSNRWHVLYGCHEGHILPTLLIKYAFIFINNSDKIEKHIHLSWVGLSLSQQPAEENICHS